MRLNIYTKTKLSAKEMATTRITVQRSECFKTNGYLFVPAYAMSTVFNSKGLTRKFDRTNCITHPTKGRLFPLIDELKKFIKIEG
tara:strand:+ start:133 stop:387 length:255 start_codon:yes stop_codon:yes gene_type:complete